MDKFIDKNPWFKKVIEILSIKSQPNDQIAFWRMRFAKNLKKESLSAENSIKLKRLLYILKIKIS